MRRTAGIGVAPGPLAKGHDAENQRHHKWPGKEGNDEKPRQSVEKAQRREMVKRVPDRFEERRSQESQRNPEGWTNSLFRGRNRTWMLRVVRGTHKGLAMAPSAA
jgi:hypothetical protein